MPGIENQTHLNRIDVFFVPDRDTCSNPASTFSSVLENGKACDSSAQNDALHRGAGYHWGKGTSGIIMAQFFAGLREGFGNAKTMSAGDF